MGVGASSAASTGSDPTPPDPMSSWPSLQNSTNNPPLEVPASSSAVEQMSQLLKEKKRRVATLSTLRKRLTRKRRTSKSFDSVQVFRDFLCEWNPREVVALVEEYDITSALKDLTLQAEMARPCVPSCKQDLSELFDYKYCTDTILVYKGTSFPVHRAIVAARCPFFHDLLSSAAGCGAQVTVNIDIMGVSVDMFNELLRYLYTGELSVSDSFEGSLDVLIQLSDQFGIPNPLHQDLKHLLETGMYSDASLIFTCNAASDNPSILQRHALYTSASSAAAPSLVSPPTAVFRKCKMCVEDCEFLCHRAVLAARSPFFRNVIQRHLRRNADISEGARTRIVLDETIIPRRYARVLLHSMYQETVDFVGLMHASPCKCNEYENHAFSSTSSHKNVAEDAMELYEIGKFLEIDALVHGCEDVIVESLTLDTLVSILKWSEQPHGSQWVRRQALNFLREEFSSVASSPVLFQLEKTHLLEAVKSDFLQATELEVLQAVLKWGEHQVVKRMEEREPNVVSHTAHSLSRRGLRKKELSDAELRDVLSEVLCHVRIEHILPPDCELLVSAIRRGLVSTLPSHMLGDDSFGDANVNKRISAWIRGRNSGPFVRPRLYMPYVEEAKSYLEEHLGQQADAIQRRTRQISHIPDTLYMIEKPTPYSGSCMSLDHYCTSTCYEFLEGTPPVLDENVLRLMKRREQELRQSHLARRAYTLISNRCEVTRQIQLRVVREFGFPDAAAEVLHNPPYLLQDEASEESLMGYAHGSSRAAYGQRTRIPDRPCYRLPVNSGGSSLGMSVGDSRMDQRDSYPLLCTNTLHCQVRRDMRYPRNAFRSSSQIVHGMPHEHHLSEVIPDIAMATSALEQLQVSRQMQDEGGFLSHRVFL